MWIRSNIKATCIFESHSVSIRLKASEQSLCSCVLVIFYHPSLGFPGGLDGKESVCKVGGLGWDDSSGGGNGNPLQYSSLESPHGQKSLAGYSPWGSKGDWMTSTAQHSLLQIHSLCLWLCSLLPRGSQREAGLPSASDWAQPVGILWRMGKGGGWVVYCFILFSPWPWRRSRSPRLQPWWIALLDSCSSLISGPLRPGGGQGFLLLLVSRCSIILLVAPQTLLHSAQSLH